MEKIASFFKFHERGTNFKIETIAGMTTFMTMAYVLAVQPAALLGFGPEAVFTDINGLVISKEAILIVTAFISFAITLFMALYTNLPFALSCGMGSNFMFGALLQDGEISFAAIMTMVLVSGIVFLLLSVLGIRDLIVRMIPKNIKLAISSAIGFFIAYLGFKNTGIGNFADGIGLGNFTDPAVFLAVIGLILIAVLTAYKIHGSILIGIILITLLGIPMGVTSVPDNLLKLPEASKLGNVIFQFDVSSLFSFEAIVLMFIAFFGDFFSTLGTLLGVGSKAEMLDQNGDLPNIQKPFLVDAVGTVSGSLIGCTTVTTYVESSAGVEAGGRTGFTALVVSILFAITIFCAPLFLMIPNAATGPALIFVGFLMIKGFKDINFDDFTEAFGPFVMIMFTIFTGSVASGISAGILAFITIKVLTGKAKEVHPGMYILAVPLLLYFITQSTI
ncbi:MAG: NCS2 family permease [Anaerorhabdus sp.]